MEYIKHQNTISLEMTLNITRVLARYAYENYQEMNEFLSFLKSQSQYNELLFSILIKSSEILEENYLKNDNSEESIVIDLLYKAKNICLLQLVYLKSLIKEDDSDQINLNTLTLNNNYSTDDKIKFLLKSISLSLNFIRAQEEKILHYGNAMYSNIEKLFIDDEYFTVNEIKFQNFPNLQQVNKRILYYIFKFLLRQRRVIIL